jgi:hypothetical protein
VQLHRLTYHGGDDVKKLHIHCKLLFFFYSSVHTQSADGLPFQFDGDTKEGYPLALGSLS